MSGGHLLMSAKERSRKSVLERVVSGALSLAAAAGLLGLSYRQCKRVYARYRGEGDAGLVHRGRGRPSRRARPEAERAQVLELYRTVYAGLGPTLAAEKLAEDGHVLDHETLRRWLVADGQWQRSRKRGPHRQRRERKAHEGELVQLDGSPHRWFGEEHPEACLMDMVDDATGRSMTRMAPAESTAAAMELLERWVRRHGVPRALYVDRHSIYRPQREPTREEQLAGLKPVTCFGEACRKLDIDLILANSPQAKGRVERKHAVYQDRLVHELRLKGITTIEGANALLESFDEDLNQRLAKPPASPHSFHRALLKDLDLRDVFCTDEYRTLANDWTITHQKRCFQILKLNTPLPRPKDKILVRTWRDGSIHLLYKDKRLVFQTLDTPPPKAAAPPELPAPPKPKGNKPPRSHPWRNAGQDKTIRY